MNKSAPWVIGIVLVLVAVLIATDTMSISCDSDKLDVSESVEELGDNIEDAADELAGE